MNVLVLEDDFSLVRMIRAAARRHGIAIKHAVSVDDAEKILKEFKPDLVWTDIGLSADETGTAILGMIPESVPTVVCTGHEKGAIGHARYWKYVPKGSMAGFAYVSIMLRAYFSSVFLRSIIAGENCREMGLYSANELNRNIDSVQKGAINRMFAKETECLDAWLADEHDRAESIARGLIDGTLC